MAAKQKTLDDLFLHTLKDIYYAEKQILKALPKMAKGAESDELKAAFQTHREQTQGQIERLEQIFELLGKPARGVPCEAIKGIIDLGHRVWRLRRQSGSRCRHPVRGPGRRALRDHPLWHAQNLGPGARADRGRDAARSRPSRRRRKPTSFSPDWPRPGSTSRRHRRRPQPKCLSNRLRPDHADPAFRLSMSPSIQ